MRTPSQTRILCWLGKFSKDLEFEWDVPRDISLPGISEALGVVRSALHNPINILENEEVIKSRSAHVIGGGSRKRKVYHLTKKGYEEYHKIQAKEKAISKKKKFSLIGEFPPFVEITGRDKIKQELIEILVTKNKLLLLGMAGIGKSALSRNVAEQLTESYNVRWSTVTKFSDLESIIKTLTGEKHVPSKFENATKWICQNFSKDIIVIDEIQNIHARHHESITNFLKELHSSPNSPIVLLISRAPAPISGWPELRLEGLNSTDAAELLDENLSLGVRINISKILGGHPLALQIAGASNDMPEKSKDVQQFISENILSKMNNDTTKALDELAALSIPISTHLLDLEDEVGDLDERALVRWVMGENENSPSKIELQHLIRNVRRAQWTIEERKQINLKIANNLSKFSDNWIRSLELYHRINADYENLERWIDSNLEDIENTDSAILSVILNEALDIRPEIGKLWFIATKLAINRGEKRIAEKLIERAVFNDNDKGKWLEIRSKLCRLNGEDEEAEKLMLNAINLVKPIEREKLKIKEISRKIVDRLPCEKITNTDEIKKMISEIDTSVFSGDEKKTLIVTIAILKHTLAISELDWKNAKSIRKDLMMLTQKNDPIIWEMECRENIYSQQKLEQNKVEIIMRELGEIINPVRRCGILLAIIEQSSIEFQKIAFDYLTKEINTWNSAVTNQNERRIRALRWYWKGVLYQNEKLIAWRECVKILQTAECTNASKNLVNKLHNLLN